MIINTFIGKITITIQKPTNNRDTTKIYIDYPNVLHDIIMKQIQKIFTNEQTKLDIIKSRNQWYRKTKRRLVIETNEQDYSKIEKKVQTLIDKLRFLDNTKLVYTLKRGNYRMYVVKYKNEQNRYMFIIYREWGTIEKQIEKFKQVSDRMLIAIFRFKQPLDDDKLFKIATNLFKRAV